MEEQVVVIYAGVNGYLDKLDVNQVRKYENGLLSLLRNEKSILDDIRKTNDLTADTEKKLKAEADKYTDSFVKGADKK
jgi:F-type H+-transporting ATPase subunit alpha